ncbi:uncharacterized protein [Ptychodera flava]|uniref:uncharacterized protein n=1 Tax=Ptychodera flava TaxID=63121 RepID=UPI00396AA84A
MAKTRVAPTKELTLPQLELMAALIGSKLLRFTYDALKDKVNITRRFLWSDNQSVIRWIRSDKKLPLFIANRVKRINEFPCTVKYCPGQDNPADLVTRGISTRDLEKSTLWWEGPDWLKRGDWPVCQLSDNDDTAVFLADSDNSDNANNGHANTAAPPEDNAHSTQIGIQHVVDANRYSSLTKLLRVSAIVLRFVSNLKKPKDRKTGYLTARELQRAENKWIKDVQLEVYRADVYSLLGKTTKTTLARQLALFLDEDNILRCGGRLHNAPLEYAAKFPSLLPTHHRFTELVILAAHKCVLHTGLQTTVTQLRQRHWIPKIRQAVKKLIRKCVRCLKVTGKPYQHPVQAPLQKYRVNEAPTFTITGVDFTGTLYVKSTHNGKETKAYICLFTCAVTRAIHLELVSDLSTASFLRAFRRFAARRSLPSKMISDNATTYLSAAKELRELFDSSHVKQYMANKRVEWSFIPKRAPWFGGFWERMIGLTKNIIKKVLGRAFITFDEMNTIITEIETTLNDRPITYLSSNSDDAISLTPSHMLHGRVLTNVPRPFVDDTEISDPHSEMKMT